MEAKVLEELEQNLGDLEHKVQAYRHDMIAGFQRYYHQTLQDMTPSAAHNVGQLLNSTLSKYPAIAPEVRHQLALGPEEDVSVTASGCGQQQQQQDADSHSETPRESESKEAHDTTSTGTSTDTSTTPPAIITTRSTAASPGLSLSPPHSDAVFGAAADSPGSPHEREQEFQGLFTPSYLPLLDSSPNFAPLLPPLGSPPLPLPAQVDAGSGTGAGRAIGEGIADLQGLQDMEGSRHRRETGATATSQQEQQGASQAALPRRPSHGRRSTDDTTCSAASDKSDTKVRRSALRRSSSSAKPPYSPRRVRFDFKGTEVLPTASPQPTDYPTPRPSSPESTESSDKPRSSAEILGDDSGEEGEPAEASLPPRKISSSEALRALSRQPMDGTVWTVVNPDADEPASEPTSTRTSSTSPKMSSESMTSPAVTGPPITAQPLIDPRQLESLSETKEDDAGEDSSSGDEFLSMAKPRSFNTKTSISTPAPIVSDHQGSKRQPEQQTGASNPTSAQQEPQVARKDTEEDKDQTSSEDFDAEEEEMFHFESGGLTAPPRPKPRPQPVETDADPPSPPPVQEDEVKLAYGTSPAVPIPRPGFSSGPPTPTSNRFQVGSLGSYKGRPVIMPVVKNPELHEQAASLGQFNTFVGGLDGRSGMDEGDLSSFRASLVQNDFTGTPRSLTERMMMEDARAARTPRD